MRIPLPVSPGEFADRLTMLRLRLENGAEGDRAQALVNDLRMMDAQKKQYFPKLPRLQTLLDEIAGINSEIHRLQGRLADRKNIAADEISELTELFFRLDDEKALIKAEIDQFLSQRSSSARAET
ncbi:MAG: hypothetical protein AAF667_03605 [Pseudomonadota bacterium]